MTAIIRHKTSGEHFLAELDEAGDAVRCSAALPVTEATDRETGAVDWSEFEGADMGPWDEDRWTADTFVVVHEF
jgi:hypothetical protein